MTLNHFAMCEQSIDSPDSLQSLPLLIPGTLWEKAIARTHHALSCGALLPIATHFELVEQDGIHFLVRILANLVRKAQFQPTVSKKNFNPFLPYEEDLFVANLSPTHVCLLNKFNVVDHHLLFITRAFEEQEALLTQADCEALWIGLNEIDGLVFYNGGKTAGASQRHKHLQLVPLPLSPTGEALPIAPLFNLATLQDSPTVLPNLPFQHAVIRLPEESSPQRAAALILERYHAVLQAIGINGCQTADLRQSGAYNLLATRKWMLVVPRSQESFQSISVNALGFAGALLVRDEEQLSLLKACTPMALLNQVAFPR